MTWVFNKCGGARFRTHPDFRVEVEGRGVETFAPGSPNYKLLAQTWKNWGHLIRKWSKIRTKECQDHRKCLEKGDTTSGKCKALKEKMGKGSCALVPPSNILAIMTQETGFLSDDKVKQATTGSPAGAMGLMQIMPCRIFSATHPVGKECRAVDREDPDGSVRIGSFMLQRHLGSRGGLSAAASNYNSGNLTCWNGKHVKNVFNWHHEQDYAHRVTKFNNTAIQMGVNNTSEMPWWMLALSGAALAGAGVYVLKRTGRLRG